MASEMDEDYATLLDAIKGLKIEGYIQDFNLEKTCKRFLGGDSEAFHQGFVIDKFFRFDDSSDPTEQSIIYAITSTKDHIKGILVNAYGIYSEETTDKLVAE